MRAPAPVRRRWASAISTAHAACAPATPPGQRDTDLCRGMVLVAGKKQQPAGRLGDQLAVEPARMRPREAEGADGDVDQARGCRTRVEIERVPRVAVNHHVGDATQFGQQIARTGFVQRQAALAGVCRQPGDVFAAVAARPALGEHHIGAEQRQHLAADGRGLPRTGRAPEYRRAAAGGCRPGASNSRLRPRLRGNATIHFQIATGNV